MRIKRDFDMILFWFAVFFVGFEPLSAKSSRDFTLQMPDEVAKIYYEMKGLENKESQNQDSQNQTDDKNDKSKKNGAKKEDKKFKKSAENDADLQKNSKKNDKKTNPKSKNIEYFIESKKSQQSAQTTHYFPQDVPPPIEQPPTFEEIQSDIINQYPQNQQLCQMGDKKACFFAGQATLYTGGDLALAQQYYWLSCALGMRLSCDEYSKISASVNMLYRANFQRWKRKVWMGDIITKKGKYIEWQKVRPIPKVRDMQPR